LANEKEKNEMFVENARFNVCAMLYP